MWIKEYVYYGWNHNTVTVRGILDSYFISGDWYLKNEGHRKTANIFLNNL